MRDPASGPVRVNLAKGILQVTGGRRRAGQRVLAEVIDVAGYHVLVEVSHPVQAGTQDGVRTPVGNAVIGSLDRAVDGLELGS